MPNYLHRTTKDYLASIPPHKLPGVEADYIVGPDLSAVVGQPKKYWVISGDVVTLADGAGQTAADAAEAAAQLVIDRAEAVTRASLDIMTRELVESLLFEINKCNTRIQELQDVMTAMKGSSGGTDNVRAEIPTPSATTNAAPAVFTLVNPKLRSEVLQTIVDDINAGVGDP